jgi:hypothetical protein
MQLRTARLCLDCEEVHDAMRCPSCASETFTYITRWIPAPERRRQPRPTTSPQAEVIRTLVNEKETPATRGRIFRHGVVGLTALGVAGWLFRRNQSRSPAERTRTADPKE